MVTDIIMLNYQTKRELNVNISGICLALIPTLVYATRTVHRLQPAQIPHIIVSSTNDPTLYVLTDYNLRPVPLLHIFDKEYFMNHLLPPGFLSYNSGEKTIETKILKKLINDLLEEINQKKKHYHHFTILKNSGFVHHKKCGLLVVKFNNYPFILKLFIETPKGFISPYEKGFEAANLFVAGGALRHTLGFTRIKTLEYLQNKFNNDAYWHDKIITPRKWFWLPENPVWLNITTYNIGNKKEDHTSLPVIYGIIADELKRDPLKQTDYHELMRLSKFVEHRIDPHTKNFFIEQITGKIALIDTELFPIILGFNTKIKSQDTYIKWYMHLAGKYLKEKLFTTKQGRIERQSNINHYYLTD